MLSFIAIPDYEVQGEYSITVQNSDGLLIGSLAVTITITNIDERGEIELSSEQPQVGTALTATLEDDDGRPFQHRLAVGELFGHHQRLGPLSAPPTAGSATFDAYTPASEEEGNTLRVTATYTDGHGPGKSVVEQPSNTVASRRHPLTTRQSSRHPR